MKTLYKNNIISSINECERLSKLYANLYDILSCEGFETKDFDALDRIQLDEELASGKITSLQELGRRFDELSDTQYRKANQLLNKDYKKAI